ncbi:two-component system connector SafA, partial [Escherichia coli]
MHATTVKNKITQRDNYKEIMSVIVVVLLLTLTCHALFLAFVDLVFSVLVGFEGYLHILFINILQ